MAHSQLFPRNAGFLVGTSRSFKAHCIGIVALLACACTRAEPTFAVVDLTDAVFATKVAVARLEALRDNPAFQQYQSALESAEADLQNLDRRAQASGLSESQREMVQKRIEHIQRELIDTRQDLERWLQAQKRAIFEELSPLARTALDELARERQLDLIIAKDAIIYAQGRWVLTPSLTERIDRGTAPSGAVSELSDE